MTSIIEPIHIEAIGLANVRFFRSPLDGPRQPWHAIEDIYAAMTLPRDLRRVMKAKLLKHPEWKRSVRTVKTSTGATEIAPHWMAQGLIGSAVECHGLPDTFEHAYCYGMMHAMNIITADMSDIDGLNYGLAAFRNENGLPPMAPLNAADVLIRPKGGQT